MSPGIRFSKMAKTDPMNDRGAALEIDCRTVKARLDAGDALVLLDCRERDEYEFVHIAAARLVPMSELPQRVGELDELRDAEIVVYCHHGVRSRQVANWLRGQGFGHVQSLAGGIDRWSQEIDATLPRY
jgi:rhodanese-related sulfurtransferase